VKTHPYLKKEKDSSTTPVSPSTKLSSLQFPRVHVQGPFGHSVDLNQSLVLNRGDIVQKYSNVTMQRGFQDAGEFQDLHEEYRQRNLQLPFPNPMPPLPARSASFADVSRKMALQNIQ
jgi:hypothetical protein